MPVSDHLCARSGSPLGQLGMPLSKPLVDPPGLYANAIWHNSPFSKYVAKFPYKCRISSFQYMPSLVRKSRKLCHIIRLNTMYYTNLQRKIPQKQKWKYLQNWRKISAQFLEIERIILHLWVHNSGGCTLVSHKWACRWMLHVNTKDQMVLTLSFNVSKGVHVLRVYFVKI